MSVKKQKPKTEKDKSEVSGGGSVGGNYIKKPDDQEFKKTLREKQGELKIMEKEIEKLAEEMKNYQIDDEIKKRRNELLNKHKELTEQHEKHKTEKIMLQEQIKSIEMQMKKQMSDMQGGNNKNYRSLEEIDAQLQCLDKVVDSGKLELLKERMLIKEMTSLHKLRKNFFAMEKMQSIIEQDKQKIQNLRRIAYDKCGELEGQIHDIQKELNEIKKGTSEIYAKRKSIYDSINQIKVKRSAKYSDIKLFKAEYDESYAKFRHILTEKKKKRDELIKRQQTEENRTRLLEEAEDMLSRAKMGVYTDDINLIHKIISYFDSSYTTVPKSEDETPVIDNTKTLVLDIPDQSKKSKKKKKKSTSKFILDRDVIAGLDKLNVMIPLCWDDVSLTIKILKDSLQVLTEKKNVETQIEIDKALMRVKELKEAPMSQFEVLI